MVSLGFSLPLPIKTRIFPFHFQEELAKGEETEGERNVSHGQCLILRQSYRACKSWDEYCRMGLSVVPSEI